MKRFIILSFMLLIGIGLLLGAVYKHEKSMICSAGMSYGQTVILDAGHGGEDGGAVAYDGTAEKDLNLLMTQNIALYFELFGIRYIPVRTDDRSVGENTLPSIRERKISDIKNRFALVNETDNSVLLSVHMNQYVAQQYCGTQVFYSASAKDSERLAQSIQETVVSMMQKDNARKVKPSDENIYLLYKAAHPSVMVECGFLSNFEELEKLKNKTYRSCLSYCITKGLVCYFNSEKEI